ncbi:MAG: hypothetical protein LBS74_11905 [Oscillospiraceae bacterium]|jgi:hypothetical protein|nr:hypothetical protein [Oscillospiraceae bacterium]
MENKKWMAIPIGIGCFLAVIGLILLGRFVLKDISSIINSGNYDYDYSTVSYPIEEISGYITDEDAELIAQDFVRTIKADLKIADSYKREYENAPYYGMDETSRAGKLIPLYDLDDSVNAYIVPIFTGDKSVGFVTINASKRQPKVSFLDLNMIVYEEDGDEFITISAIEAATAKHGKLYYLNGMVENSIMYLAKDGKYHYVSDGLKTEPPLSEAEVRQKLKENTEDYLWIDSDAIEHLKELKKVELSSTNE